MCSVDTRAGNESPIMEKALNRTFSWLIDPTSAFILKNLVGAFNQEKAQVGGLVCVCEIFANLGLKI